MCAKGNICRCKVLLLVVVFTPRSREEMSGAARTFTPSQSNMCFTPQPPSCLPVVLSVALLHSHGYLLFLRNVSKLGTPKSKSEHSVWVW